MSVRATTAMLMLMLSVIDVEIHTVQLVVFPVLGLALLGTIGGDLATATAEDFLLHFPAVTAAGLLLEALVKDLHILLQLANEIHLHHADHLHVSGKLLLCRSQWLGRGALLVLGRDSLLEL